MTLEEKLEHEAQEAEKAAAESLAAAAPQQVAEPQAPETPAPDAEPAPQQAEPENTADDKLKEWEHKYISLKGRWKAQSTTLATLQAENEYMKGRLSALEAQTQPQAAKAPEAFFDDNARDIIGEDAAKIIENAAKKIAESEINKRLSEQTKPIQQATSKLQQEMFESRLDAAEPSWRKLENSPEFKEWLDEIDPMSDEKRSTILDRHWASGKVAAAAKIYQSFAAPSSEKTKRPDINQYVTPKGQTAAPSGAGSQTAKVGEYHALVDKIAKGMYDHDPAGLVKAEKRIDELLTMISQNRVTR